MILFTIFTFFLALVSVWASVISTPTVRSTFPDPLPFAQLDPRTPVNDCDTGFYTDTTDGNSPLIEDCEALSHNLYEGGTNYLILNNKFSTVAQYKTCAVGLVSWDCENNNSIVIPPPPSISPPYSAGQDPLVDMQSSLFSRASSTYTRPRSETKTLAACSATRSYLPSTTPERAERAGWGPGACSTARLSL